MKKSVIGLFLIASLLPLVSAQLVNGGDEVETGETPATWAEDKTTYECNRLIWKK